MNKSYLILVLTCFFISGKSYSQQGVKINTTPEQAYQTMINNPAFIKNAKGEDFCWNA